MTRERPAGPAAGHLADQEKALNVILHEMRKSFGQETNRA